MRIIERFFYVGCPTPEATMSLLRFFGNVAVTLEGVISRRLRGRPAQEQRVPAVFVCDDEPYFRDLLRVLILTQEQLRNLGKSGDLFAKQISQRTPVLHVGLRLSNLRQALNDVIKVVGELLPPREPKPSLAERVLEKMPTPILVALLIASLTLDFYLHGWWKKEQERRRNL